MSRVEKPKYFVISFDPTKNKYVNISQVMDQESGALTTLRGRANKSPELEHYIFQSVRAIYTPEPSPVLIDIKA
jgi:hypothetical protein